MTDTAVLERNAIEAQVDRLEPEIQRLADKTDKSADEVRELQVKTEVMNSLLDATKEIDAHERRREAQAEIMDDPANASLPADLFKKYANSKDNHFGALTSKEQDAFVLPESNSGGDTIPSGFNWTAAMMGRKQNVVSGTPANPPDGIIPVDTADRVRERLAAFGGPLHAATIMQTATGNILKIPVQDTTSRKSAIVGSRTGQAVATSVSASNATAWPEFFNVDFGSYLYRTGPVGLTRELVRDAQFDLVTWLERHLVREGWRGINEHLTTGSGTGQPDGMALLANTTRGVQTATGPSNRRFSATESELNDQIGRMLGSVDDAYLGAGEGENGLARAGTGQTGWMMHRSVYWQIWSARAGTRRPLAERPAGSPVRTIEGDPVFISNEMAAVQANGQSASNSILALYGWLGGYTVRVIGDERVRMYDDSAFDLNNSYGFAWFASVDGHYTEGVAADNGQTDAVTHFITQ